MTLRPIAPFALFGSLASLYGFCIALMPLTTGLFRLDPSRLIADADSAKAVETLMRMADGLSVRMLATSAFAFFCFAAIAYLDRRAAKRSAIR